jgi:NADP-dependent 3-hydroxy acid dehydrogenase YdfG
MTNRFRVASMLARKLEELGAVATALPDAITEPDIAERMHTFYEAFAIPADSFARAVAFAISQPDDVDVNEILFRPTRREL